MNALASDQEDNRLGVVFATTQWSVVLAAQESSPAADAALEKLCRTYWWPLHERHPKRRVLSEFADPGAGNFSR